MEVPVAQVVSPRNSPASVRRRAGGGDGGGREERRQQRGATGKDSDGCSLVKKTQVAELLEFEETPAFLQSNRHVLGGYRVHYSWKLCLRSLFQLHNETLNVWTHLIAAVIFAALFYPSIQALEAPTTTDIVLFGSYIACAVTAMLNSAVFHLFGCTSQEAYKWLATLDYSGISLLVVGSYLPLMYWGFHCSPLWQAVYMGTVLAFGSVGLALSWIPYFSLPGKRSLRSSFYLLFGWFSLIPVAHLIYLDGTIEYVWRVGRFVLLMGIIYSIGAAFYVSQIPERWTPGKFDYSSHVIWHLFVFMAALVQLWALVYCHQILPEHSCTNGRESEIFL